MFGMRLVVGASRSCRFAEALRHALARSNTEVLEQVTFDAWPERYEWARRSAQPSAPAQGSPYAEMPTLAIHATRREGLACIDVRGPRAPVWHLHLARALSEAFGGWTAVMVNDRLHGEHGYGFACCGAWVEAAVARSGQTFLRRGLTPGHWAWRDVEEQQSSTRFFEELRSLAGLEGPRSLSHERGQFEDWSLRPLAGRAIDDSTGSPIAPTAEDDAPEATPAARASIFGVDPTTQRALVERLERAAWQVVPGQTEPTYAMNEEGVLDERAATFLDLRGSVAAEVEALGTLLAPFEVSAGAVRFEGNGRHSVWTRTGRTDWERSQGTGLDTLVRAWAPFGSKSGLRLMRAEDPGPTTPA